MDGSRFDRLARSVAYNVSRRRVLQGLGLGVLGVLGLARSGSSAAQGKVEICHINGQGQAFRIEVAEAAMQAHLRHGDEVAAPLGSPCVDILEGPGFECGPAGGLSACGALCVLDGAGDGQCGNTYLGCVPNGEFCTTAAKCCSGVCGAPTSDYAASCGGCLRVGVRCEFAPDACCDGLVCVPDNVDGTLRCAV